LGPENNAMNLAASSAPDQVPPSMGDEMPASVGDEMPASVVLLFFAAARVAAGTARDEMLGHTVGQVLDAARARYGDHLAAVLDRSRVWVNGEPAPLDCRLQDGDEVAVLPPVSGGAGGAWSWSRVPTWPS